MKQKTSRFVGNTIRKKLSRQRTSGMTLIEVLIYIVLLSFLLAGFMDYAFRIHLNNMKLNHEIEDA